MIEKAFSTNGESPEKKFIDKISDSHIESLEDFVAGNLIINDLEQKTETSELEEKITFNLRFKGGGREVLSFIDQFYKEKKEFLKSRPYISNFGIFLDGDKKEFVFEIEIVYPPNISNEEKDLILNETNEVINEFQERLKSYLI